MTRTCLIICLSLLAPPLWAQANDLAAERAKIANQRIEAEARVREEQERQARLAAERAQAATREAASPADARPVAVARPTPAEPAPVPAPTPMPDTGPGTVDRMLQQIRTLGELRDAGYVTDDEFERIKARILDGSL